MRRLILAKSAFDVARTFGRKRTVALWLGIRMALVGRTGSYRIKL